MMLCTIPVAEMTQIGQGRGGRRQIFFFEKKMQKTFITPGLGAARLWPLKDRG
jgi:hypothetical protein